MWQADYFPAASYTSCARALKSAGKYDARVQGLVAWNLMQISYSESLIILVGNYRCDCFSLLARHICDCYCVRHNFTNIYDLDLMHAARSVGFNSLQSGQYYRRLLYQPFLARATEMWHPVTTKDFPLFYTHATCIQTTLRHAVMDLFSFT